MTLLNWLYRNRFSLFQTFTIIVIFLIGVAGVARVLYTTSYGPWAFSDSAAYISYSKNFFAGKGLVLQYSDGHSSPLQEFPPLYPLVLGIANQFTGDYLQAARWLDAISFGLLILAISLFFLFLTHSPWLTIGGALLTFTSPVLLRNFTGAMTEPLFMLLAYSGLFLVVAYFVNEKRGYLIFAAILSSLSALTRYVGLAFITIELVGLLLINKKPMKSHMKDALYFIVISFGPLLLWLTSIFLISHTIGTRSIPMNIDYSAKLADFIQQSAIMFKSWLPYISYRPESIPESSKIMVFVLFFILWIVLLIRRFLKMSMEEKSGAVIVKIFIISFISVVFFSIFLTFTYLFTKPAFVYSERIWSPIIPGLILVFLSSAVLIAQPLGKIKNWFVIGLVILVLFLSRYYFLQSTGIANEIHEQGYGYTSKEIQNSGIINALEKLPKDMYLISNDPGLVLLYTNRMPDEVIYFPPYPFGSQNGSYELAFRQNHSALIILMDALNAAYGDKAQERLISFTQGLQVGFSSSIGNIYFNPSIEGK